MTESLKTASTISISTNDLGFVIAPIDSISDQPDVIRGTDDSGEFAVDQQTPWPQDVYFSTMQFDDGQVVDPIGLEAAAIEDSPNMNDQELRLWALELAYKYLLNFTPIEADAITSDRMVREARVFEQYVRVASEVVLSPAASYADYYGYGEAGDDDPALWDCDPNDFTTNATSTAHDNGLAPVCAKDPSPPTGRQRAPLAFDPLRCG
jgi:hypothetical protein